MIPKHRKGWFCTPALNGARKQCTLRRIQYKKSKNQEFNALVTNHDNQNTEQTDTIELLIP